MLGNRWPLCGKYIYGKMQDLLEKPKAKAKKEEPVEEKPKAKAKAKKEEAVDYSKLTVVELKKIASERKISTTGLKKAEIIAALEK